MVVRRGHVRDGMMPVGVRGLTRSQRFAAFVAVAEIADRLSPEDLTVSGRVIQPKRKDAVPALSALDRVAVLLLRRGYHWGPGGSVGFEIATGVATATASSDLDLILRQDHRLEPNKATDLLATLVKAAAPARIDVMLETPMRRRVARGSRRDAGTGARPDAMRSSSFGRSLDGERDCFGGGGVMTVAFLFPGQGSQSAGLLHHLPQHAEVTRTIDEASDVLSLDLDSLDTAQALHSTAAVQTALLIAGVATARALLAENVRPAAVAGMSVGAFGAAVACGTLSFRDALRLVHLRGELMQEAFPSGYGLAAIEGLNEVQVEGIVERTRTASLPVYVSNINAPRQIVVAGSDRALEAVTAQARQQGARRAERLAVSVPSHCPLLQPIADRLLQLMARLALRPPSMPYVSNRGGRALYDAEAIRQDLATSVAHPVRWYDALEVVRELGVNLFIEMAPGHVSTHLVAKLFPDVRAVSIADQGLRYATVLAARQGAT